MRLWKYWQDGAHVTEREAGGKTSANWFDKQNFGKRENKTIEFGKVKKLIIYITPRSSLFALFIFILFN